jgi:Transposase, Mutator family
VNGHHRSPEREVLTAARPIPVKVPKVRDRSGSGVKFNSSIVPPYVRKSPRASAAVPWLYLKGISTSVADYPVVHAYPFSSVTAQMRISTFQAPAVFSRLSRP